VQKKKGKQTMKKLMILAAVVVASVAANAAAINWNSGTIALPSGTQAGKNEVTAYLFNVDLATYNVYAAYTDAAKLSNDIYDAYKGSLASADGTKASSAKGVAKVTDGADYGVGTYYAVLLYTATENEKDYWMGNFGQIAVEATMDVTSGAMALTLGGIDGATATSWQTAAVPEPTSGLLMLLGIAGLALRRRRA